MPRGYSKLHANGLLFGARNKSSLAAANQRIEMLLTKEAQAKQLETVRSLGIRDLDQLDVLEKIFKRFAWLDETEDYFAKAQVEFQKQAVVLSTKEGTFAFDENGRAQAVKFRNGYQIWAKNGHFHRADGPAVVYTNKSEEWWLDGKKHRKLEDGPAVTTPNNMEWWFDGRQISMRSR